MISKQKQNLDILPHIKDYAILLTQICAKENISRMEARKKYGQFTYKQWYELLK